MASVTDRKPPSSIRPGLASNRVPSSPRTPQRATSSTFSSPSNTYRQDEDAVIIELGSRYLRAGFEGENSPQCCLTFGPSVSRRLGDYRDWLPGYAEEPKTLRHGEEWGSDHELWRMDLRGVDVGLVEDKLDRAVREAYTKHLLTDPGSQRLILVLPSVVPHRILESVFVTLFSRFRYHGITLLPQPTMSVVAAGLRSGLVVDVGWAETIVTAIYEYRECHTARSIRAVKLLLHDMGRLLNKLDREAGDKKVRRSEDDDGREKFHKCVTLDYCEEITTRLAWCQQRPSVTDQLGNLSISEDQPHGNDLNDLTVLKTNVSIPLSSISSSKFVEVPLQDLSEPVEQAFFASNSKTTELDDNEYPLPALIYHALLALPPDVRGICMSRIIITGGGSKILGLKKRIMDELTGLLQQYGWDPIRGKVVDSKREKLKEMSRNCRTSQTPLQGHPTSDDSSTQQVRDVIEEKLKRNQARDGPPSVHGVVRQVESLGSWAGASLVARLRVKGLVEIDRDIFLQHGMAGASREADVSVPPQRLSFGPGVQKSGKGDRSSWTLGAWA